MESLDVAGVSRILKEHGLPEETTSILSGMSQTKQNTHLQNTHLHTKSLYWQIH